MLIHGGGGQRRLFAVQLAREAGARVVGSGRGTHRETALGLGVERFVDLDAGRLDGVHLAALAQRLRDGRLQPILGAERTLSPAVAAFAAERHAPGKTVVRVAEH